MLICNADIFMVPIELIPIVHPKVAALATWAIYNIQVGIDMGITVCLTDTNFGAV